MNESLRDEQLAQALATLWVHVADDSSSRRAADRDVDRSKPAEVTAEVRNSCLTSSAWPLWKRPAMNCAHLLQGRHAFVYLNQFTGFHYEDSCAIAHRLIPLNSMKFRLMELEMVGNLFAEQRFIVEDGAVLRYFERPAMGRYLGTAVLLHSLFFHAEMFRNVTAALPPGWRVICPDHRGQGASAGAPGVPTMERLSRDVEELIGLLGDGPVHLVGSSMGGYVAQELALRQPNLLRSCVLSCCTSQAEQQPERFAALESSLRKEGPAARVDDLAATMFGSTFLNSGSDELLHWRRHFTSLDRSVADAVHEVFARPSYESRLHRLTMPLLLVSGELDRAKRPADMQFIADRVKGSHHVVFNESGHSPPVEEARRFAREIAAHWATSTSVSVSVSDSSTKVASMPIDIVTQTTGSAFAADALPFKDLAAPDHPPFEVRDGAVYLRGSVSRSSGGKAFPARAVCQETGTRDMEPTTFGPRGNLYSFSTVHVSSSRPTPYTIGYVDFEVGVRVLAQVEAGGIELTCDQPVELRAEGDRWFVSPIAADSVQRQGAPS